jgi:segregation and condensation protein B
LRQSRKHHTNTFIRGGAPTGAAWAVAKTTAKPWNRQYALVSARRSRAESRCLVYYRFMEMDRINQPALPHMPEQPAPATVQLIESLLFVAGEPVTIKQLGDALELPLDAVEQALAELSNACRDRGIRVQRHHDQVQLVSAPESAAGVARLLGVQANARLSNAALEVLAIIAYRQPITRARIDAIRGVDSSASLRALLSRDLIAESGRLDTVGRPILYATTQLFLQQFGLSALAELPPLHIPDSDPSIDQISAQE